MFEELVAKDMGRARAVYETALKVVPHTAFTFGKLWLMAAEFLLRQGELATMRALLGEALGRPKRKVFAHYIGIEAQLGCF